MIALLVDDDSLWRTLLREALKHGSTAFLPVEAESGEAALVLVPGCHLVVTDISMPGMGGIEFIRRVRCRRQADAPRIVAVSAESNFREAALGAGADAFIEKSFLVTHMAEAAFALLGSPEARRRRAIHAS
jgi:CheY-like chemotaxis protein